MVVTSFLYQGTSLSVVSDATVSFPIEAMMKVSVLRWALSKPYIVILALDAFNARRR